MPQGATSGEVLNVRLGSEDLAWEIRPAEKDSEYSRLQSEKGWNSGVVR